MSIHISIREHGDAGEIARDFDQPDTARFFEQICHRVVKNLADANRRKPPMPSLPVL